MGERDIDDRHGRAPGRRGDLRPHRRSALAVPHARKYASIWTTARSAPTSTSPWRRSAALLGTLPGPLRMPADVAGRIDAALAAEALLRRHGSRADGRRRVSRERPALRARCPMRRDDGGAPVSRETSTWRPTVPPARPRGRHRPGPRGPPRVVHAAGTAVLGAVFTAAASAASAACSSRSLAPTASGQVRPPPSAHGTRAAPRTPSPRATWRAQVHDLLASKARRTSPPDAQHREAPPAPSRAEAPHDPHALARCPTASAGHRPRRETPLASKRGHLQGHGRLPRRAARRRPTRTHGLRAYVVEPPARPCVSADCRPAPRQTVLADSHRPYPATAWHPVR